jgi:hypothetical protein
MGRLKTWNQTEKYLSWKPKTGFQHSIKLQAVWYKFLWKTRLQIHIIEVFSSTEHISFMSNWALAYWVLWLPVLWFFKILTQFIICSITGILSAQWFESTTHPGVFFELWFASKTGSSKKVPRWKKEIWSDIHTPGRLPATADSFLTFEVSCPALHLNNLPSDLFPIYFLYVLSRQNCSKSQIMTLGANELL